MIAKEGWPFILVPICVGFASVFLDWPIFGWPLVALGTFGLFFFRNPGRVCAAPPDIACSPADGRVIKVGSAPQELIEQGLTQQVSVFMSVFSVHVNRAAIDGRLNEYTYSPGRKISAFKDKASSDNEQNLSVWEGPAGRIGIKQIAGLVARRIVFDHSEEDVVSRGERIGLIRYGSRLDVFLPAGGEILVSRGDRVRAGETPLARMPGSGGE